MNDPAFPSASTAPMMGARQHRQLERLRTMARLLDTAFRVPGTRHRFGLDALIGLVPGIGDAIGAIFSTAIIFQAARLGAPQSVLVRMFGNVSIDTIVGEVPLLGDLFDFGWKANTRNLALLEEHLRSPSAARTGSRRRIVLLAIGLLLLLLAVIVMGVVVANLVLEWMK
jgi:hypothetical protein